MFIVASILSGVALSLLARGVSQTCVRKPRGVRRRRERNDLHDDLQDDRRLNLGLPERLDRRLPRIPNVVPDVTVVGAGLGGLVTAASLARGWGMRVHVYERREDLLGAEVSCDSAEAGHWNETHDALVRLAAPTVEWIPARGDVTDVVATDKNMKEHVFYTATREGRARRRWVGGLLARFPQERHEILALARHLKRAASFARLHAYLKLVPSCLGRAVSAIMKLLERGFGRRLLSWHQSHTMEDLVRISSVSTECAAVVRARLGGFSPRSRLVDCSPVEAFYRKPLVPVEGGAGLVRELVRSIRLAGGKVFVGAEVCGIEHGHVFIRSTPTESIGGADEGNAGNISDDEDEMSVRSDDGEDDAGDLDEEKSSDGDIDEGNSSEDTREESTYSEEEDDEDGNDEDDDKEENDKDDDKEEDDEEDDENEEKDEEKDDEEDEEDDDDEEDDEEDDSNFDSFEEYESDFERESDASDSEKEEKYVTRLCITRRAGAQIVSDLGVARTKALLGRRGFPPYTRSRPVRVKHVVTFDASAQSLGLPSHAIWHVGTSLFTSTRDEREAWDGANDPEAPRMFPAHVVFPSARSDVSSRQDWRATAVLTGTCWDDQHAARALEETLLRHRPDLAPHIVSRRTLVGPCPDPSERVREGTMVGACYLTGQAPGSASEIAGAWSAVSAVQGYTALGVAVHGRTLEEELA